MLGDVIGFAATPPNRFPSVTVIIGGSGPHELCGTTGWLSRPFTVVRHSVSGVCEINPRPPDGIPAATTVMMATNPRTPTGGLFVNQPTSGRRFPTTPTPRTYQTKTTHKANPLQCPREHPLIGITACEFAIFRTQPGIPFIDHGADHTRHRGAVNALFRWPGSASVAFPRHQRNGGVKERRTRRTIMCIAGHDHTVLGFVYRWFIMSSA